MTYVNVFSFSLALGQPRHQILNLRNGARYQFHALGVCADL